jgi:hypothetical protein
MCFLHHQLARGFGFGDFSSFREHRCRRRLNYSVSGFLCIDVCFKLNTLGVGLHWRDRLGFMKLKQLGRTDLGECYVYTKSKGLLYGEPLTKVVPTHYSEADDFKLKIHWQTNDEVELRRLHEVVLKVVEEPGSVESFLEIRAALRARRTDPEKNGIDNLTKAKSAQMLAKVKSLGSDEIELVASNLKGVS